MMQMRYVPSARDLRVHGLHGQASVAPSRRAAKRSESFAAVGALFSVAVRTEPNAGHRPTDRPCVLCAPCVPCCVPCVRLVRRTRALAAGT